MRPTASPAPTFALANCARAQYDMFANPRQSAAEGIPYGVVIQNDLLDALATGMTLPLVSARDAVLAGF
ncbi:MAG: CcdB family protein [Burkholderiales bacterium]|nr:CcdB family protein [Burkholderiales bacterium]